MASQEKKSDMPNGQKPTESPAEHSGGLIGLLNNWLMENLPKNEAHKNIWLFRFLCAVFGSFMFHIALIVNMGTSEQVHPGLVRARKLKMRFLVCLQNQ